MSIIPRIDGNWVGTVVGKSIPSYKLEYKLGILLIKQQTFFQIWNQLKMDTYYNTAV